MTLHRALPWISIVGLIAIWEFLVWLFDVPSFFLPAPSEIFGALWEWRVAIFEHSFVTFYETIIGFAVAMVVGMLLGVAIGSSALLYHGMYPLLIGFNTVPKSAMVPLLVMWFGIGVVPAIITAFLISFFPILVNVATGIATVEPELRDVLRVLGARKTVIIRKIAIPRSMPYFFASLKVAITFAFIGTIVSETIAANEGIGHLMSVASGEQEVALAFAALFVMAAMGIFMYLLTAIAERRTTRWSIRGLEVVAS